MSHTEKPRRVSLGRPELLRFAQNDLAFYGLELERISSLFLAQMLQMKSNRVIDIFNITDEIKALEGVDAKTQTKKERQFKPGTPLEEFWYTHFTDPRFMSQNFASEFGYQNGGNTRLSNMVGKLFNEHKGEYVNEGFAQALAHEATVGAYEKRSKRNGLTGEWIIFSKYKGMRY